MKTKIAILSALLIGMMGYSQKDEIKAAEKAMKSGDGASALTALEGAAGSIDAADAKERWVMNKIVYNSTFYSLALPSSSWITSSDEKPLRLKSPFKPFLPAFLSLDFGCSDSIEGVAEVEDACEG